MARDNKKASKKLCIVVLLTLIFAGVEIAGGLMANSIAILSDAAHLCSDVIGLGVSIWAVNIA
jgi:Co/Zn/Cd efflux system component